MGARLGFDDLVAHGESGVLVPSREGTAATYLDGAEQYLLESLRTLNDVSVHSAELGTRVRDWASLYHLTPYRATILDALGLQNGSSRVLELGAGCGAVTRWLGEHFEHVDAVEGSLARALVARERCRDLAGVRVAAANFFDLELEGYDITTLIGVLEYSHLYHPEYRDDPDAAARSNLELARRSLAEDGMLVIAIENKLGLKYLAGSHEDHAARRFEGIHGYPSRSSAVTWSARELERLVLAAGFTSADFYLPFPDYKLARTVFDAALADETIYPANWVETPFPDRGGPQATTPFSESLALRELAAGGLLRELANSFLVLAYNGDRNTVRERLAVDEGWAARHYSLDRRPAFRKRTSLERGPRGLTVRNVAAVPTARASGELALRQELADEPYRPGHQLLFTLLEHAAAGRLSRELPGLVAELHAFLVERYGIGRRDGAGSPLLRGDALDVTPWNVIVDPETGDWNAIDGEWRLDGVLPVDYVLWRGLHHAAARHAELLAGAPGSAQLALAAVQHVMPGVDASRLSLYEELEAYVQAAAGAGNGGGIPVPGPRLSGLFGAVEESPRILARAGELIEDPRLLQTFLAGAGTACTLVAYAPNTAPGQIAPPLEAALEAAGASELDVVLLAFAPAPGDEEHVAESALALLSASAGEGPFAALPLVGPDEAEALRRLVFPDERPEVELPGDPSGPAPAVSIVIPVFNRLELTQGCLESLRATAGETSFEVIAVDNGSSDGTAEFLRAEQAAGRLRCAINRDNTGFARACNLGAEHARGDLLVFLNNDTIAGPGWLDALVEAIGDPGVGLAGSRLLYPDGTIQHAGIVWNAQGELDHVNRGLPADAPAVLVPRDFAAVTGACVILRRELFRELGGFDDSYHMYVEDVDLCLRVWEAGLRVAYCPASVLVHLENASVSDVEWRNAHVRAGWARLTERWARRWPDAVRRFAWPHELPGSPRHPAALAFAGDLVAHPQLLEAWTRTFSAEEAKLVVYGPGGDMAALGAQLEALFRGLGLEAGSIDVLALASPEADPPPGLLAAVAAVVSTARPGGAAAALPRVDEHSLDRLRELVAGDARVA